MGATKERDFYQFFEQVSVSLILVTYPNWDSLVLAEVEVDDLVHDDHYFHYYFGLFEYFEQYALDLHLESYLVVFQPAFPGKVQKENFEFEFHFVVRN